MFWNIFFAVVGAIPPALTTWLGFHLTASPEVLSDKDKVRRYRIAFVAMLLLSLVVAGITAYRGTQVEYVQVERAHFAITEIWETSKPNWPLVGEQLGVNFRYKNVGNGTAYNTRFKGHTVLKPDYSPYSEKEAIEEFEKWLQVLPVTEGSSLAKDATGWNTAYGAIVTPEDLNNLMTGRKVMYVVSILQFRDDLGNHRLRICRFLQPPEPTRSGSLMKYGVLASCSRYNDEAEDG